MQKMSRKNNKQKRRARVLPPRVIWSGSGVSIRSPDTDRSGHQIRMTFTIRRGFPWPKIRLRYNFQKDPISFFFQRYWPNCGKLFYLATLKSQSKKSSIRIRRWMTSKIASVCPCL